MEMGDVGVSEIKKQKQTKGAQKWPEKVFYSTKHAVLVPFSYVASRFLLETIEQ